jgi:enoyl-CoA hydratase
VSPGDPLGPDDGPVRYAVDATCAIVTIHRPEARNAISPEAASGLEAAIDLTEADDRIRAVVLAGSGAVFCAGADLEAVAAGRGVELSTEGGFGGFVRRERTKPLLAAVDGPALAGGAELVLACDLVVASTAARFGPPEMTRGAGGVRRRPVSAGPEDPNQRRDAVRHHRGADRGRGRVSLRPRELLCAHGGALAAAVSLARRVTANAPLAVRESRLVVLGTTHAPDADG